MEKTEKKIAFVDIDGTLSNRAMPELMLKVIESNKMEFRGLGSEEDLKRNLVAQILSMRRGRLEDLRQEYKRDKTDESFGLYSQELTEFLMYRLQRYSGREVRKIAREAIQQVNLEFYQFSRTLIDVLKDKKFEIVAISGSPQFLVDEFVSVFGFSGGIGQKFELDIEDFVYKAVPPFTYTDKHLLIEKYISENFPDEDISNFQIIVAGDTAGDLSMMRLASAIFAINPNEGLIRGLCEGGLNNAFVVAVRKNWTLLSNFEKKTPIKNGEIELENSKILLDGEACERAIRSTLKGI